jgi:hypothetical protein
VCVVCVCVCFLFFVAPIMDPLSILDPTSSRVVLELSFNKHSGRWIFHCLRTKLQPNHVSVVFETLCQIAEVPITMDDLKKHATGMAK